MSPITRSLKGQTAGSLVFLPAYNIFVASTKQQGASTSKHPQHALYATEAGGLLFIGLLLLIVIIIRYWHSIHWSLR
jgi:F0F1-type ATP synthase assembly protein I